MFPRHIQPDRRQYWREQSTNLGGSLIGTAAAPIDPLLGPLADNGGPTLPDGSKMLTHALLPGSPAINAGDPAQWPAWAPCRCTTSAAIRTRAYPAAGSTSGRSS